MVAVFNAHLDSYSENGGLHIMPDAAHEVSATLLITIDGRKVSVGNIRENFDDLSNVLVRLGTKVSDGYPSSIGFRVLLRTNVPKIKDSGSIEDNYHLVSCKFDPRWGEVSYMHTTKEDMRELVEAQPLRKSLEEDLRAGTDQGLYRMDFVTSDTNGFLISHHKPDLHTSNGQVKKVEKLLSFIAYATKVSLFFIADKLLVEHLDSAIKQNCVGAVASSWKTALPNSAIPRWQSNVQKQMVAGSIDIYNVLLTSLHEKPLRDGPGTLVRERPEATRFREFIRKTYPNVRQEANNKVYPVMLNVSDDCLCIDLPFGASMLNRGNTYAAINALHGLLAAHIASDQIAIVTLYPTQVAAYQDALRRCHKHDPLSGYDLVQVGLLEAWVDKTVSVAIVDLVRTANSSGNLGYLSQANRLKILLTLHRNGLIVVGDRGCTVTSKGSVASAKLDKVLQWFVDNGRIVQISNRGLPHSLENQSSIKVPSINPRHPTIRQPLPKSSQVSNTSSSLSSTSSNASHGHTSSVSSASTLRIARKYVGIPGLEHLNIDEPGDGGARVPLGTKNDVQDLEATCEKFVSQGHISTRGAFSRPEAQSLASSTNAGVVHPSDLHKTVPKVKAVDYHSKWEAGLTKDAGAVSEENVTPEKETRSEKLDDLTMEAPTHECHEVKSSGITEVATTDARFEAVTKRFKMETGSEVFHNVLKDSRSRLPNLANPDISGTSPASLPELGIAISRVGMPLESAFTENEKSVTTTKEISPRRLRVKVEAVSPLQNSTVDLPSSHPTQAAPQDKRDIKDFSSGQSLKPRSAKKASNGLTDQNEAALPRQNGIDPSTQQSKLGQEAEPSPDFATLYQKKYRAIRTLFANMADMPRDPSGEDQLFRRLAEAFMDENVEAFEDIYTKLLGMAAGL